MRFSIQWIVLPDQKRAPEGLRLGASASQRCRGCCWLVLPASRGPAAPTPPGWVLGAPRVPCLNLTPIPQAQEGWQGVPEVPLEAESVGN